MLKNKKTNKQKTEEHTDFSQSRQNRPAQSHSSRERIKATYLALCELSEHGCQAIIINVTICFNSNIKNVNGLLAGSLQFKENIPHK